MSAPSVQTLTGIATLPAWGFDHNAHHHSCLLDQLPTHLGAALDLGCGTGEFSRLLAVRSDRVLGVDLSPTMIRVARERSAGFGNLSFETADALNWHWPRESFDGIVSIAALHHLPLKEIAERMKQALRPGGVLVILDVYREDNLADYLTAIAAIPVNLCFRLRSTGFSKAPRAYREAWGEHQKTDRFLTLSELREVCRSILPGARVRRHLLWRYSLVWQAPKN